MSSGKGDSLKLVFARRLPYRDTERDLGKRSRSPLGSLFTGGRRQAPKAKKPTQHIQDGFLTPSFSPGERASNSAVDA